VAASPSTGPAAPAAAAGTVGTEIPGKPASPPAEGSTAASRSGSTAKAGLTGKPASERQVSRAAGPLADAPRVPGDVCWELERPGAPTVHLGDLVRLPGEGLGVVRELCPGSGGADGLCRVSPLSTDGRAEAAEDVELPAHGLEVEDLGAAPWAPRARVERFEEEPQFADLVYQPSGLKPFAEALRRRQCKICALGGSISLQKAGYRVNLVQALEKRGVKVEDRPLSVGTAGSKPLALIIGDRIAVEKPDLLIVEVAVNDGDELLESTPRPDVASILRAAEGIVRTVRRKSPKTAVVFLEMFLRDDTEAARVLKTGAEAWRDSKTQDAVGWYHEVGPRLHRHVCRRYGLAQLDLVPALRAVPTAVRQEWFRDDCHHSEVGGERLGNLVARLLLWAVRQPQPAPAAALPPALDAKCWCNGRTIRIGAGWLSPQHETLKERDLLKLGEQSDWYLLHAGGQVTIPFKGRACGLMTLLGPDAPTIQVGVDGGPPTRLQLLDRWCYYWRDAVVLICEGLSDSTHMLQVEVTSDAPDHRILKRPPSSPLWNKFLTEALQAGRPPQRLWLQYACAVEGDRAAGAWG